MSIALPKTYVLGSLDFSDAGGNITTAWMRPEVDPKAESGAPAAASSSTVNGAASSLSAGGHGGQAHQIADLQLRYPVFGGWSAEFEVGYDVAPVVVADAAGSAAGSVSAADGDGSATGIQLSTESDGSGSLVTLTIPSSLATAPLAEAPMVIQTLRNVILLPQFAEVVSVVAGPGLRADVSATGSNGGKTAGGGRKTLVSAFGAGGAVAEGASHAVVSVLQSLQVPSWLLGGSDKRPTVTLTSSRILVDPISSSTSLTAGAGAATRPQSDKSIVIRYRVPRYAVWVSVAHWVTLALLACSAVYWMVGSGSSQSIKVANGAGLHGAATKTKSAAAESAPATKPKVQ